MEMFLHWLFQDGITFLLYVLLFAITLFTVKEIIQVPLKGKVTQARHRARLRKKRVSEKMKEKRYESKVIKHLYFLLQTTSTEKKENDVFSFLFISIMIFIAVLLLLALNLGDWILSFVIAGVAGMIPYTLLRIKLKNTRTNVGNQLAPIVGDMTQVYTACHYDMYHTLVETIKHIDQKSLKGVFIRLVSDLQTARHEKDLQLAIEVFIYTCGNSWSKRLGNIIIKAYKHDENVLNALLTLNKQMEETEKMLEEEKSTALDPVINGFVTVPVFIAALVLGYYVSGPQDWLQLQFGQDWPLLTFVLATVLTIFSVFIALLLKEPKNDL